MNVMKLPITNNLMGGDYTGTIYIGSDRTLIDVFLDTGSSALAVDGNYYKPDQDKDKEITNLAQEVQYGTGWWLGPVIQTDVVVEETGAAGANQSVTMNKCNLAVTTQESGNMFGKAKGILGLAYRQLNDAYDIGRPTWPSFNPDAIEQGNPTTIEAYFTQLEEMDFVPNKFSFYTLRSLINYGSQDISKDPLNNGYFILGGGEDFQELYNGSFQTVKVMDDMYYNTNLKSIRVGDSSPIAAGASIGSNYNSIVDSGTNGIYLTDDLFKELLNQFRMLKSGFYSTIMAAMNGGGIKMSASVLQKWPNIYVVLEGVNGDVTLTVAPETYWQLNSDPNGNACFVIFRSQTPPSILGLPLMNNYFCVFDRSADQGLGVIKFAPIKK